MSAKTTRKGGRWVLFAWFFLFLLTFLLWLFYYDWDNIDASEDKENNEITAGHLSLVQPYEPAENRSLAVGETFIISNNTIVLASNTGYIEIEQYDGKETQPLLTVDVFPEKNSGDKR